MLEVGNKAPDFKLVDKDGKMHSLSDYSGKKVVLYFYPKDSTSGCTKQAIAYQENLEEFKGQNVVVIGISKDSPKSHAKFQKNYSLEFLMLCDESTEVMQAYGVWKEKKLYGKTYMGAVRSTFIIDENGIIAKIDMKVKADQDATCVLNWLKG